MSKDLVGVAAQYYFILTVHHPTIAEDISQFACSQLSVFLKINVGLERLGLEPGEIEAAIRTLRRNPNVTISGLYTHMYVPDGPHAARAIGQQFEIFANALGVVARLGVNVTYTMVASSAVLRLTGTSKNAIFAHRRFRIGLTIC